MNKKHVHDSWCLKKVSTIISTRRGTPESLPTLVVPGFAGELVPDGIYSEGFFAFWIVRRGVEVFQTKKKDMAGNPSFPIKGLLRDHGGGKTMNKAFLGEGCNWGGALFRQALGSVDTSCWLLNSTSLIGRFSCLSHGSTGFYTGNCDVKRLFGSY